MLFFQAILTLNYVRIHIHGARRCIKDAKLLVELKVRDKELIRKCMVGWRGFRGDVVGSEV